MSNNRRRARSIRPLAFAALAILAALALVAPGLYLLGVSSLLGGFWDFTAGIHFGPPGPPTLSDQINDTRNAAELASMKRQAVALIASGAILILVGLAGARRSRSRSGADAMAEASPDRRIAVEIER